MQRAMYTAESQYKDITDTCNQDGALALKSRLSNVRTNPASTIQTTLTTKPGFRKDKHTETLVFALEQSLQTESSVKERMYLTESDLF